MAYNPNHFAKESSTATHLHCPAIPELAAPCCGIRDAHTVRRKCRGLRKVRQVFDSANL